MDKKGKKFTNSWPALVFMGKITIAIGDGSKPFDLVIPCRVQGKLYEGTNSGDMMAPGIKVDRDLKLGNNSEFEGTVVCYEDSLSRHGILRIIDSDGIQRNITVALIEKIAVIDLLEMPIMLSIARHEIEQQLLSKA